MFLLMNFVVTIVVYPYGKIWNSKTSSAVPCLCLPPHHWLCSKRCSSKWTSSHFLRKIKTVNSLSSQDVTQRKQQHWSLAPCGDFARWTKFKTVLDARVHKTLPNYIIFHCGILKVFFFLNSFVLEKSHTFLDEDKKSLGNK